MGRALRHYRPGIYHLAAHGSDRRHLYLSDHDRTDFLDRLSNTLWQRDIDLLASAGLADDPLDWPWASTRAHAGIEPPVIPLEHRPLQAALDRSPNWKQRYLQLIQADETRRVAKVGGGDRKRGNLRFPLLDGYSGGRI